MNNTMREFLGMLWRLAAVIIFGGLFLSGIIFGALVNPVVGAIFSVLMILAFVYLIAWDANRRE